MKEEITNEFNINKLLEFTGNDKVALRHTLELLKETLNDDIRTIEASLKESDIPKISAICHKIRPNFDLIGLKTLVEVCNTIEYSNLPTKQVILLANFLAKSRNQTLENLTEEIKLVQ